MFLNVIRAYRDIVAICDKELLGKRFEEGNLQLDVKESFYKGEEKSHEKAVQALKRFLAEDATFNIVGKKSIAAAIEAGVILKEETREIHGIPFALVLL